MQRLRQTVYAQQAIHQLQQARTNIDAGLTDFDQTPCVSGAR